MAQKTIATLFLLFAGISMYFSGLYRAFSIFNPPYKTGVCLETYLDLILKDGNDISIQSVYLSPTIKLKILSNSVSKTESILEVISPTSSVGVKINLSFDLLRSVHIKQADCLE